MTLREAQTYEVEAALKGLVGLPLADIWDNLGACSFVFAEARPLPAWGVFPAGREASWTLTASCEWRLEGRDGSCLSVPGVRGSRREPRTPDFARLEHLAKTRALVVADVGVRRDGALRLDLSDKYVLTVLPRGEFELDLEAVRGDRRWSLRTPEDDPRGDLLFRVGSLEWEPKGSPPACIDLHVEVPARS